MNEIEVYVNEIKQKLADSSLSLEQRVNILNEASENLFEKSPQHALSYGLNAVALAKKHELVPTVVGASLKNVGQTYLRMTDYDKTEEYLKEAEKVFRNSDNLSRLANVLLTLSTLYVNTSSYDKAEKALQETVLIQTELGDNNGLGKAYVNYGLLAKSTNKSEERVITYYRKGIDLLIKSKNHRGVAFGYNNLASHYFYKTDYPKALESYLMALRYNACTKNLYLKGNILNNIGVIYELIYAPDEAREFYEQSLDIRKGTGHKAGIGSTLMNLGYLSLLEKNFNGALSYFDKAFDILEPLEHHLATAHILFAYGEVYMKAENYEQAYYYTHKGLRFSQEHNIKSILTQAHMQLGIIEYHRGNAKEAKDLLESAVKKETKGKKHEKLEQACITLALLYENEGDYQTAYNYLLKSKEELARYNDEDSKKLLARERVKYEILEKTNKILSLEQEKAKLEIGHKAIIQEQEVKLIKAILEAQTSTKEAISSILHTEVGLEIIIIKKLLESIPLNSLSPDIANICSNILQKSDVVYEALRKLSHIINEKDFLFLQSIQSLVLSLNQHLENPTITFYPYGDFNSVDNKLGFFLLRIIKEGIYNCLKHADALQLDIHLTIYEETIELTIEDNGKGFDVDAIHDGIGIANMETLIQDQLSGSLVIDSSSLGTTLMVEIPL